MLKMSETFKTISDVDVHVGHKVRCIRMALGMTQKELAEKIGISFQQLQKNEKGDNKISCSRLHILSIVLGVSIEYFFEGLPSGINNYNLHSNNYEDSLSYSDSNKGLRKDLWDFVEDKNNSNGLILSSKDVIELVKYYNKLNNPDLKKAVLGFLKLCKNCNS